MLSCFDGGTFHASEAQCWSSILYTERPSSNSPLHMNQGMVNLYPNATVIKNSTNLQCHLKKEHFTCHSRNAVMHATTLSEWNSTGQLFKLNKATRETRKGHYSSQIVFGAHTMLHSLC